MLPAAFCFSVCSCASDNMQSVSVRPFVGFCGSTASQHWRRAAVDFQKQPGLRPLHASPIFHRPRRRDFFSSNASLASQKETDSSTSNSRNEVVQIQKRKTARPNGAKTSLRRVAVEAQRSKVTKNVRPNLQDDSQNTKLVTAYAVAETFDIPKVADILRAKGYEIDPLNTGLYPQVVHIQVPVSSIYRSSNVSIRDLESHEVGDIFVFPSGTLVTWALPEGFTSYFATRTLLPAANNPHREPIETEDLDYIEDSNRDISSIRGDTIILGTKPHSINAGDDSNAFLAHNVDNTLTKIAFSSGFARSTTLAVLETNLSTYLASTAGIPSLLSKGSRLPLRFSRSFILRKTGQLLQLRAQLNLYSELTDSLPDLFWDSRHELNLENYYDQVGRALDVGIRIKVLNEKMDYAGEIANVLRERLSEKHGLFLEWTIIVLIAIEVGFEVLRLYREGFWAEVWERGLRTDRSVHSQGPSLDKS
jgi:required for meiotic nuclear division protein 1